MFYRIFTACCVSLFMFAATAWSDPLPSWSDGPAKERIVSFVESVTDPDGKGFVPVAERIAVFDNDGTLWAEQPVYFQLIFALDEVARRAKDDPSILTSDALRAAANGDMKAVMASGKAGLAEILKVSHSGIDVETFQAHVNDWLETARHPSRGMAYDQMTYQPMVELLRYLRDEGFSTWIVSGGGLHFMRAFADRAYGIPPQQVIGSSVVTSYQVTEDGPKIMKEGELFFYDDKEGKPLAIDRHIGMRPILAVGNSDGDFQMLEYTTAGDGPRLGVYIHHTDADREWAYDRKGHIGVLNRGLDDADQRGWLVVDMARDWKRVFTGATD